MGKKIEKAVVLLLVCFIIFKIFSFGQEVCEGVNNMATNHYTELETLVNEF